MTPPFVSGQQTQTMAYAPRVTILASRESRQTFIQDGWAALPACPRRHHCFASNLSCPAGPMRPAGCEYSTLPPAVMCPGNIIVRAPQINCKRREEPLPLLIVAASRQSAAVRSFHEGVGPEVTWLARISKSAHLRGGFINTLL